MDLFTDNSECQVLSQSRGSTLKLFISVQSFPFSFACDVTVVRVTGDANAVFAVGHLAIFIFVVCSCYSSNEAALHVSSSTIHLQVLCLSQHRCTIPRSARYHIKSRNPALFMFTSCYCCLQPYWLRVHIPIGHTGSVYTPATHPPLC